DAHDDSVYGTGPPNAREDDGGDQRDDPDRDGRGVPLEAGEMEQVAGASQRRRRGGGGLGEQERPPRREAQCRGKGRVAVFVGSAADRIARRKLGAGEGVAGGDARGEGDGEDDERPGDAGGDPDTDENAGAEDRPEPEHDGGPGA